MNIIENYIDVLINKNLILLLYPGEYTLNDPDPIYIVKNIIKNTPKNQLYIYIYIY